jgi:hypothetical protein
VNQREGRPFLFYIHPWEIDPNQPRLAAGTRLGRWRHYLNLESTERKLVRLLSSFRFGTLSDVVRRCADQGLASHGSAAAAVAGPKCPAER